MPKKRTLNYAKPTSVPHPSLASSSKQDASWHSNGGSNATTVSVNDLIRHLRQTQISSTATDRPQQGPNAHTVHPSLKDILAIPDTPAPRPRPGMRNSGGRRVRGPAGPPPPKSWLERRDKATTNSARVSGPDCRLTDKHVGSLPGIYIPNERSLQHLALKTLAKNWIWHTRYDQYYLATLTARYKETLLTYISTYYNRGIDCGGLYILFLDESELEGATGSESVTHLDLGTSVGRAITLKEFKDALTKRTADEIVASDGEDVPESWDEDECLTKSLSVSRFPALTHLSLSNPAIVSWKGLLNLSIHLATLTHLSLAFWPAPSMTPNSKTAYRESPAGNINYGASNFYSRSDGDLSEAAGVLKRLSKATYCLQWLDLTGCSDWVQALGHQDGPDWFGAWRALETVKIGQGWIPSCLEAESSEWREAYVDKPSVWVLGRSESDSIPLKRMREELESWAAIEDSISRAETNINMTLKSSRRNSAAVHFDRTRNAPVTFDRGWKGWWVEDALKHINTAR